MNNENIVKEFILKTSITEENNNIIENAVKYIRDTFDIFSVAIRVKEGNDFPYYSTIGFSDEFIKIENMLCCKNNKPECICGSVLTKVYKEKEWFTKKGSFWTNSITDLLSITNNGDGNNLGILAKIRGTCFRTGYESMAIIPIVDRNINIGLIQLNDFIKGKLSLDKIETIEIMAESLGCSIGVLDDGILAKLRKKALLKKSIIDFQNDIKEIKLRK